MTLGPRLRVTQTSAPEVSLVSQTSESPPARPLPRWALQAPVAGMPGLTALQSAKLHPLPRHAAIDGRAARLRAAGAIGHRRTGAISSRTEPMLITERLEHAAVVGVGAFGQRHTGFGQRRAELPHRRPLLLFLLLLFLFRVGVGDA